MRKTRLTPPPYYYYNSAITANHSLGNMENIYTETIDGKKIELTKSGELLIDGIKSEWYKDQKSKKPWIPAKRKSFIGLIKQILRD